MSLSGLVKVEVIIDPRGTVKNTKIVGGSPVLASAAEQAVRQWVFQAGPDTTTQIVEFRFQSEE